MTVESFKNPILGIFVKDSGHDTEHCFGALFERTVDGRIKDYRLISYTGTPIPPSIEPNDVLSLADGGVLIPVSPTAANQLRDQLDTVRKELTADPKVQRYHYSQRVKLADSMHAKAKKGRILTNCVDFLMRSAKEAGIDVGAIHASLPNANRVGVISDAINEATPDDSSERVDMEAMQVETTTMHYKGVPIRYGTNALYFRTGDEVDMLEAVNALPREMLTGVSDSTPLGQPLHGVAHSHSAKALASCTGLANGR